MADTCEFPGCERTAFRAGLCPGHTKQLTRGMRLTPLAEIPPPFDRMIEAHDFIREAKRRGRGEDKAAILRFHKAARAWLVADGWSPLNGDVLVLAFFAVADAETDEDFDRALARFRALAERWALGQGMTPPERVVCDRAA